jgi:two-component sensor histidine kinase
MHENGLHTDQRPGSGAETHQDYLAAENVSLRLLLAQAEINTRSLLAKAGIDARERDASDKLQKLILEELHRRIKNTLATVGAIVSQSLRNLQGAEHAQHAIEGRLLGRAHDLLLQARWTSADLGTVVRSATEAFDDPDEPNFSISGPDIRMTSGAAIAVAMTLNELCTNTTKFVALSVPGGVGRHHLDAGPTETALAPYLDRDERSDGPPSRKAQLRNTANRDARQATQGRCAVNLCVDRFHVRIRRTNGLCDFVGGISWYSGIAGRVKSCRWFFTRPRSAHNHEE